MQNQHYLQGGNISHGDITLAVGELLEELRNKAEHRTDAITFVFALEPAPSEERIEMNAGISAGLEYPAKLTAIYNLSKRISSFVCIFPEYMDISPIRFTLTDYSPYEAGVQLRERIKKMNEEEVMEFLKKLWQKNAELQIFNISGKAG